jgi:acetyl esterase/lipase
LLLTIKEIFYKKGWSMKNKYPIHPDFNQICEMMEPVLANDQEVLKAMIEEGYRVWNSNESDSQIRVTKYDIPSADGTPVPIQVLEKQGESESAAPCLVYYHGGGFVIPFLEFHFGLIREYILRTGCKAVCVNYRLAPEFPFPKPLEDCCAALLWTTEHAGELGIDPKRIVIGGDSAGGHFTAAVSMMARDKGMPAIAGQMLIYPATDTRLETDSMKSYTDTPVWNSVITAMVYQLYLKNGDCGMRSYVSPLEAESLENLPRAYVEVADFDALRDEGVLYAEALQRAGVTAELRRNEGTVHAFDYLPGSAAREESLKERARFLNSVFAG